MRVTQIKDLCRYAIITGSVLFILGLVVNISYFGSSDIRVVAFGGAAIICGPILVFNGYVLSKISEEVEQNAEEVRLIKVLLDK